MISHFDPVLRDRVRLERIFGFDYAIEIYVPEKKREYGYYVFPLLEGSRFVGRIDMKADRARDALAVKALWMEPRLSLAKARRAKLERELERQSRTPDHFAAARAALAEVTAKEAPKRLARQRRAYEESRNKTARVAPEKVPDGI